jgi:hypothetical protein
LGAEGGLTVGWGGTAPTTNGAIIKGSVGIGGAAAFTPASTLEVRGNIISRSDSNEGGRIQIQNFNKTGGSVNDWSIFNMTGVYQNGLAFWRYQANGGNPGPAMFLTDAGDVGIGTNTPSAKLHVTGEIIAQTAGGALGYIGGDGSNDIEIGSKTAGTTMVHLYNPAAGRFMDLTAGTITGSLNAGNLNTGTISNARLPERLQVASRTISDWNDAVENGWYQGSSAANAPEGVLDWWLGYVESHYDRWVTQTVHRFTADGSANTHVWRRSCSDAGVSVRTWGPWYKLQWSQAEQDARYSNTTHQHGNILSGGKLSGALTGSVNQPVMTDAAGNITAGSFGSTAGTICQGDDPRLSRNVFTRFREDRDFYTHRTQYRLNTFLGRDEVYICGQSEYAIGRGATKTTFNSGFEPLGSVDNWKSVKYWIGPQNIYIINEMGWLLGTGRSDRYQTALSFVPLRPHTITFDAVDFSIANDVCNGYPHMFYINSSGELYGWGYQGSGQLGLNTSTETIQQTPTKVTLPAGVIAKKIYAMGDDTGAWGRSVLLDTQGRVYVAGANHSRILGIDSPDERKPNIVQVFTRATIPDNDPIVSVAGGYTTSATGAIFLLSSTGKVYSSGNGFYSQHGAGNQDNRSRFTRIIVGNQNTVVVQLVVAGQNSSCIFARTSTGNVYCWGQNYTGCFGEGNTTVITTPTLMRYWNFDKGRVNLVAKRIGAMGRQGVMFAALGTNNLMYTCGAGNYFGSLGRGVGNNGYLFDDGTILGDYHLLPSYTIDMWRDYPVDFDLWGGDLLNATTTTGAVGITVVTQSGNIYSTGYGDGGSLGVVTPGTINTHFTKALIR